MSSLQQRTMIEIKDLDQWTVTEEVADVVADATGASHDTTRVISLRKGYGRTQTAFALLLTALCQKVIGHRLRVGMVNCRIRQGEQKTRCYCCLSFGHVFSECKFPGQKSMLLALRS